MSTFAILAGFALMLFLPCAAAALGSRKNGIDSAYSDRLIDQVARPSLAGPVAGNVEATSDRAVAYIAMSTAEPFALGAADLSPSSHDAQSHRVRIQRNEIAALLASAVAARAQADALAANARLAEAKAEAAAAEAIEAEEVASAALHGMRRAA